MNAPLMQGTFYQNACSMLAALLHAASHITKLDISFRVVVSPRGPFCPLQRPASAARLGTAQLQDLAGSRAPPRAGRQTNNSTEIRERAFVAGLPGRLGRYVGLQRLRTVWQWNDSMTRSTDLAGGWVGRLGSGALKARRWSQMRGCMFFWPASQEVVGKV